MPTRALTKVKKYLNDNQGYFCYNKMLDRQNGTVRVKKCQINASSGIIFFRNFTKKKICGNAEKI